jgi:hypothetical protein
MRTVPDLGKLMVLHTTSWSNKSINRLLNYLAGNTCGNNRLVKKYNKRMR